jgi:dihydroorotase
MPYDLLIRGGTVLDPSSGVEGSFDVAVENGLVAAIERNLAASAARELDAAGLFVTPGLVDLHTHIYPWATYWGVEPDPIASRTGVTTWVDAGTSGGFGFPGFRKWVIEASQSRVLAFLNLSEIGLTGRTYELSNLEYSDAALVVGTVERHRDVIVGIKVRADVLTTRGTGIAPLRIARRVADELDLPIMVHVGKGPPALREIIGLLRGGDILTHCFTGHDNRIVDGAGDPLPFVREAWDRGLILDIGHGTGSFSFATAAEMAQRGLMPDVISTDTHHMSIQGPMFDLPTTLSKFLALGLSLRDVIERATIRPASAIRRPELGSLKVGSPADIALLAVVEGAFTFYDVNLTPLKGTRLIRAVKTIRAGVEMSERMQPAIPFWVDLPPQQRPIIGRKPGEAI